jgi:hypothetical protein
MLRTNLATRPFYNERLVHLLVALAAAVVGAITLLNVVELVRLSRENTMLSAAIREDRQAAADLTRRARETRQGIDQSQLKVVIAAAREANALIDGRTFSWTAFLNHIESTLPPDVMLVSVRPAIEDTGTHVTLGVSARRSVDIDEFVEALEATGAFDRGLLAQINPGDEGLVQGTIEIDYVPVPAEAPAPPAPDSAPRSKPGPGGSKGASR